MDIEINEVQEIIKNLEIGSELSIKEEKYLKIAKLCVQLAAENVAMEKAQRYIEELREWNAGLAQESCERQQRISELLEGKVGNALLERENHHVELVGKLAERIAELESRTVKLPPCVDDLHGIGMVMPADAVIEMLAAAGIKVEAE